MRDQNEDRSPMTEAEHETWFAETKAKIQRSLDDPRPALSGEELEAELDRVFDELYGPEADAAA